MDSIFNDPQAGVRKDSRTYGKNLVYSEQAVWLQDFHQMLQEDTNKSDLTLIVQVNETWESADDLNLDTKSEVSRKNMLS